MTCVPLADVSRLLAIVALVGSLGTGCDRLSRGNTDASTDTTQTAGVPPPISMPPTGEIRLRVLDDGITLLANAAPRGPLMEVLAMQIGFQLEASDLGVEPVTVEMQHGQLEDALPTLLPDRAYRVDYRHDAQNERHRLARLQVAPPGVRTFPDRDAAVDANPKVAATEPSPSPPPAAKPDRTPADEVVDWKEVVAKLDDADPDERIEALEKIDPEGEGLPLIVDRLAHDPDPRVRVTAAEILEFSDTLAGVDALVGALSDNHRDVVLAAIDALELTDDYTVTKDLTHLLEHPDADIRSAAREAIEFIEPDEDD